MCVDSGNNNSDQFIILMKMNYIMRVGIVESLAPKKRGLLPLSIHWHATNM